MKTPRIVLILTTCEWSVPVIGDESVWSDMLLIILFSRRRENKDILNTSALTTQLETPFLKHSVQPPWDKPQTRNSRETN